MSGYFTEHESEKTVNARIGSDADARLAEISRALIHHLHAFIKDVELTQEEWEIAIDFLTRTGQICSDKRQEYILLSDILGVSMLVDTINNRRRDGATENTVFGPFHVEGAPERPMGALISLDGKGETCLYKGRVLDTTGAPVANALVDVWSDNADGFYDVQQPDIQPSMNNRGVFRTGADGAYSFIGIRPVPYPIPDDGPVGQFLRKLDRHPNRPAHLHFMLKAQGFEPLITHIFASGDPWLESDAVFGVKDSLIVDYQSNPEGDTDWTVDFDFVLQRA